MNLGKKIRLKYIRSQDASNMILLPMDHGLSMGPISGLENIEVLLTIISQNCIDAVIMHRGLINSYEDIIYKNNIPVIMHLSGGIKYGTNSSFKVSVATVKEAVSMQITVGGRYENQMLIEGGKIAEECYKYGMPLLTMMYAENNYSLNGDENFIIAHLARIGAELGADIVKVKYSGNAACFKKVVEACPVPLVISGGEKIEDECYLHNLRDAMTTGIQGIAVGRNIFQSSNMNEMLDSIHFIVHKQRQPNCDGRESCRENDLLQKRISQEGVKCQNGG